MKYFPGMDLSAPVRWYAVGLVVRPNTGAPKYDTVYQEVEGATPLTRAQIQRLHAEHWGGTPVFRAVEPPWQRPPAPPGEDGGLAVAGAAGALAGGLWAVFCAVVPFAVCSC